MTKIIVGESIKSSNGEIGKILSFTDIYVEGEDEDRVTELRRDAFETGELRYESPELQEGVDAELRAAREERKGQSSMTTAQRREWYNRRLAIRKGKTDDTRVRFERVRLRLGAAPVDLRSFEKSEAKIIRDLFAKCDSDTVRLYKLFRPVMRYTRYSIDARSKYHVGFVCNYGGIHVLRVFTRNDHYQRGPVCGTIVTDSDTTEIMRAFFLNGKNHFLGKNMYGFNTTERDERWHKTSQGGSIVLDEVIRCGDCGYLNDYIAEKEITFQDYMHLLLPALNDRKAEIVFKYKRYKSCQRIENVIEYLSEYSMKQIDFAAKNDVINTLNVIKDCGVYDADILRGIEEMSVARQFYFGGYNTLVRWFDDLGIDKSDLNHRLVSFIRRVERFDPNIYRDYLLLLSERRVVTLRDIFAGDYVEQHDIMRLRRATRSTIDDEEEYASIAKELTWIDRVDNGYHIIVPKTIDDFKLEGELQHNCVYTNRYYSFVISRDSIIVFIRKERDVPFVTVEFDYNSFSLVQAYGKHNTDVDTELREYIVSLGKRLYRERSEGAGDRLY